MRAGWWIGLAACTAVAACAPEPDSYYGGVQSAYDGYVQPGYVPPSYAAPGYLAPNPGLGYVPPYSYPVPVPVAPGFGYERRRDFGYPGYREREFRREFEDRRFRDDQERFYRERGDRERFERSRSFERPRPPEPPRQPPAPPLGQSPPVQGGIFPGVPRPVPR